MDSIGEVVFPNFGVRHVASQRLVHEKQQFCVFLDHIVIFLDLCWNNKDAQRNFATNGPNESP